MSQINKNLTKLIRSYKNGAKGCILEGSSRSGKTWSGVDFVVWLCAKAEKPITINIIRETYNSFKTTLYDDFNRRLPQFGIVSPCERSKDVASFKMFGSKINLLGADKPSKFHGAGCDFAWYNEMITIPKSIFDQQEQRTRQFWWGDYNPNAADHYLYNSVTSRDDVDFLKTTFIDNPFISDPELNKILSYDPNNPDNIRQGTADDFMWNVYGLGLRDSPKGLIFKKIEWIDTFPDDIEEITYGQDFGYTNSPSATVKVGRDGRNLYIEYMMYEPTENVDRLSEPLKMILDGASVWCDSADPGMIRDLRIRGIKAFPVKKFQGSIIYGLDMMKRYKIHVVRSSASEKEFKNYKYRTVNDIQLNEPVKDYDHGIDAARYAVQSVFNK